MKRALVLLLLLLLPVVMVGCGGGGGGGGSSSGSNVGTLVIQLQDSGGLAVDGIVTVGSSSQATLNGKATFSSVSAGTRTVSVQVNGVTSTKQVTVVGGVTTTAAITITSTPSSTPVPTSPPDAPF